MKIVWSENAKGDIRDLSAYIRAENPWAAVRVVERIFAAVENLRDMPNMGVATPSGDYRLLFVPNTPYFVVYRLKGDEVQISYVYHTARQRPSETD